jgi:hypothetical protein
MDGLDHIGIAGKELEGSRIIGLEHGPDLVQLDQRSGNRHQAKSLASHQEVEHWQAELLLPVMFMLETGLEIVRMLGNRWNRLAYGLPSEQDHHDGLIG